MPRTTLQMRAIAIPRAVAPCRLPKLQPAQAAAPHSGKFRAGVFSFLRVALTVAQSAMSTPPNKYTYPITNICVIAGATIEADVDLGFRIRQRQVIRLAGIDAPELRSKDAAERELAKEAKTWLERVLIACKPSEVVMHSTGLDKYGRSLAVIWARDDHGLDNVNEWMIASGYSTPMK